MVVRNANIHNIMGGMESTGGVRLHNHRRKLKQRFDIIRKLGQGTYGKVQLGINKETGQEVAIKTIKKAKIETEADLVRIRREIQIMSSVQHPNIIHIYEVFENREKMVLVMEYAAGGELYDYLSERKVLPQDEARRIFRQIATAVYYCHKHKICHRDLKLENILLDEHGSAKIADFGLSNVFDEQRLLNTFCGSPLYASPEIVKGTPYHGPEVDCWSLGVLLYTLVYGAMPFDGSNFKRLVKQISQGDYFEPKKPSPASSLIREMLTVSPARRAGIEKVCSHWWVNEGYSESCLQIAEELADQTPVRLDLLLSLAPPPSGVGTDNIMQQGVNNVPSASHAMVPTRCHSVGSLMELDHAANEQQAQRTHGKQSLYGDSGSASAQSTACAAAGQWDSTKRKLEEGASSSDVNLRGAVKRDRGKRRSCEESTDTSISPGKTKQSVENEMEENSVFKLEKEEEKMETDEISSSLFPVASLLPQSMESLIQSKDSGVETQDDGVHESSETGPMCKSSTVSSTATIMPTEDSSSAILSPSEEQVTVESGSSEAPSNKNKKSPKKKRDSITDIKISGDLPKDLEKSKSEALSEKKDSNLLKETLKTAESKGEKLKKSMSIDTNEIRRNSKNSITKADPGNSTNKIAKPLDLGTNSSKSSSGTLGVKDEIEAHKITAKSSKSKGHQHQENINSGTEVSSVSNVSEPSTPPSSTVERRRSKIFETADKFNSILAGSPENKNVPRDKPKKLFIPGVKVSDFKKAFERKLSSPEISVSSFSKKYPSKSEELNSEKVEKTQSNECSDNNICTVQKATSQVNNSIDSNAKAKTPGPLESDQVLEDLKGKKQKITGRSSTHIATDDNKNINVLDSPKTKTSKTPSENSKHIKTAVNKLSDPSSDGNITLENEQPVTNTEELKNSTEIKPNSDNNKMNEIVPTEKKGIQTECSVSTEDGGNEVPGKVQSKSNDTPGKKKLSKVEITLKSATLPRRKTSKAEIKLDPAIPPIEYKTEIEHMISAPTVTIPTRQTSEDYAAPDTTPPFRSWSLEPESLQQSKMATRECIIPIQIEHEAKGGPNLTSPPVGRPPAYPFQQRSMSQTQRGSNLSRQSTQESDSEVMEPIRKSPREYIIPIAVEGGGYVTPRAGSLEPSASDDSKSKQKPMASSRSNYRRMSSLLSDTSEDEGLNMSPAGLQRHGSLSRGREDGRTFHFHRLRSSRPMRHSLERNDSLSSAEEDDDDDDDEGFEILTAESLFSTLLSRVRSLTQRLTVEDGKRPGFPSNHFVNQLTNISHPSTTFKHFYSHHREPLSRRLSETSTFPRLLNRSDFAPMHQRSLSRDSSNCDSVNSEASCSVGTFPRGSANQKYNTYDNLRRGARNLPSSRLYTSGVSRGGGWQNKRFDESSGNNPYLFLESSVRKSSSSGKNICKLPCQYNQNQVSHFPRKLNRTLSLRSGVEDRHFCDSPLEGSVFSQYSGTLTGDRHSQCADLPLPIDSFSSVPSFITSKNREMLGSPSQQNLASVSSDGISQDSTSGCIPPPLPQSSLYENKSNNIPRTLPSFSRAQGQNLNNTRQWRMRHARLDNYQHQPKHSSSLPSIVEGLKNTKYKGNIGKTNLSLGPSDSKTTLENYGLSSVTESKKTDNKQINNTENSVDNSSSSEVGSHIFPLGHDEIKLFQDSNVESSIENNQISLQRSSKPHCEVMSNSESQPSSFKTEKCSLIPKRTSPIKQEVDNENASVSIVTDKDDNSAVQKRKVSRFLRPDFFDTPPEESTYVKEREAKKAAEAEIKKAKRLARRTSSMRESSALKTETQNNSNVNVPDGLSSINKRNSKGNVKANSTKPEVCTLNLEEHNERSKSNLKALCSLTDHKENKNIKNQIWSPSVQKGDNVRKSGSGLCSTAKSRVGKAISSLQEHNFTPWDKKVVATESTYLKRAVSVDDVSLKSQGSLTKSNPKLGRKISSVLGLFSKLESPSLESQYQLNALQTSNIENSDRINYEQNYLQNEQKVGSLSKCSSEKMKNKLEESKKSTNENTGATESNNSAKSTKQSKSLKDLKCKHEVKKNTKRSAVQVISDAISNTNESHKTGLLLQGDSKDIKNGNIAPPGKNNQYPIDPSCTNIQSLLPNVSKLSEEVCVPGIDSIEHQIQNIERLVPTNDICEQSCVDPVNESYLSMSNHLDYSLKPLNINPENSFADETESVDSWCACSETDGQDNLVSLQGDDDDDKEAESVEDRIRRKSFYTRFNDVKKKGRKKSSQFLKDCRTSLLPGNYHKNGDNQSFPSQNSNTGAISKKLPIASITTETHNLSGNVTNDVSQCDHENVLQEISHPHGHCDSGKNGILGSKNNLNDHPTQADETLSSCALVRPAVFAQGILNKTSSLKSKIPTQPSDGSKTPPILKPGTTNAITCNKNTS